jgi:outer membrane protein
MSIFVLLALIATPAPAVGESPWRLGVALGYGERSNPLAQSEDIPIVVDLDIAWFGERLFFDNGDLGLTFADNRLVTASVVGRVNSDRVFFGRTNTRFVNVSLTGQALSNTVELTIPDRSYAVEAGIELLAGGRWGHLQVTAHQDVSNTHDGYEIDLEYGSGLRYERWYIEPLLGISFKSRSLNNYYWGVRASEANEAMPAYDAGSGFNLRGGVRAGYHFSRNWAVSFAARYERLNDEAAASPIVVDRSVLGYFVGVGYRF